MKKNRTLMALALLLPLTLLAANLTRILAVPLSPYIMVTPEKIIDTTKIPGSTYTVTIYTDYTGSDVWAWQFSLEFNPAVLQGATLANGNLITTAKHSSATFLPGSFDNTAGKLSLTGAYFFYQPPTPPFTTSGPGTLAQVTFDVVGYGSSDITLVPSDTKLIGYVSGITYEIVDGSVDERFIGHGFFSNKLAGDVNGDRTVDFSDLFDVGQAYGSSSPMPNWNTDCDFDHDGDIDAIDLAALCDNYGESI